MNLQEAYLTKGHENLAAACPASGTGFQPVMIGKMPVPPGL